MNFPKSHYSKRAVNPNSETRIPEVRNISFTEMSWGISECIIPRPLTFHFGPTAHHSTINPFLTFYLAMNFLEWQEDDS